MLTAITNIVTSRYFKIKTSNFFVISMRRARSYHNRVPTVRFYAKTSCSSIYLHLSKNLILVFGIKVNCYIASEFIRFFLIGPFLWLPLPLTIVYGRILDSYRPIFLKKYIFSTKQIKIIKFFIVVMKANITYVLIKKFSA